MCKSKTTKKKICIDFEYFVTLKNRDFIKQQLKKINIRKLILSLLIRNINNKIIKINEYVINYLYIDDIIIFEKAIIIYISIEIHLIDELKINMFIDVNVLKSQKMILNFEHNIFVINNYQKIKIVIDSINKIKLYLKRIVKTKKNFTMQFY